MHTSELSPLLREALALFPKDKDRAPSEDELNRLSGGRYDLDCIHGGAVIKLFDVLKPDGTKLGVRAVYARVPAGKQLPLAYDNVITTPECLLVLAMCQSGPFESEIKFWGKGNDLLPWFLIDEFNDTGCGVRFKRGEVRFDVSGTTVLIYEG